MQNLVLSNRIKEMCKSKKISVKFLLEQCDMNRNTIYDLEKKSSFPSSDKLSKIADRLNCSVDYLLGRTDIPEINKGNIEKIDFSSLSPEVLYKLVAYGGDNKESQPPIDVNITP